MKYFKIILISFAMLCMAFVLQNNATKFVINHAMNSFTTDNLNNTYIINGEELIKYNSSGKLFVKYSNKRFGNITVVDATNALKVLLYYKEFQQLIFLDSQLSQNGDIISVEKLGYEQCELACTSFNNSFWIYSKQNNELIRFNEKSLEIAKTGNLKQLLQANIRPNYMIEHNSYLYLNCPDIGIYVFDMYGTFNKIISIKHLKKFQVYNNVLYYFSNSIFYSYDSKFLEEKSISYSDSLLQDVRIEKDRFYMQYNDSVKVLENLPK